MELLGNHLQIFVSLIAILGVAGVALLCDLLKGNNEQLREVNTELRIRVEEARRERRFAPVQNVVARPSIAANLLKTEVAQRVEEPELAAVGAEPIRRQTARRAAVAVAEPAQRSTGDSLAEARALARELMGRAASRSTESVSENLPQTPEVMADTQTAPAANTSRKDWSKLLRPRGEQPYAAEVIPFESIQNNSTELMVPAGFHEGMMLARIFNVQKAVRGLVMVIGINDLAARRENKGQLGADALMASIAEHLKSILGPTDFACKTSEDEFLMICPNERDAKAQRRLGNIAESLWDFQLRSVGTSVILFSWGGVEAKGEPFADVLSTAAERMRETRRGRRSLALDTPRRVAV